ncbi:MAG: hypothetical protein AAF539_02260 [Planctomycetota bacterium]
MRAETPTRQYSPRTLQQVRLDCGRAIARAGFCLESSDIIAVQCVDDREEREDHFGHQLWYFEGIGVDEGRHRQDIFGVVEYQIQFGLQELVEDGVFDSPSERERFRHLYNREVNTPAWQHPAHKWLLLGVMVVAAATCIALMLRNLLG